MPASSTSFIGGFFVRAASIYSIRHVVEYFGLWTIGLWTFAICRFSRLGYRLFAIRYPTRFTSTISLAPVRSLAHNPHMRRLIGIGVLVMTALAVICFTVGRLVVEPGYQGKSLRQWVIEFDNPRIDRRAEAAEAMRQMGTRAVPFLVHRLRQKD